MRFGALRWERVLGLGLGLCLFLWIGISLSLFFFLGFFLCWIWCEEIMGLR